MFESAQSLAVMMKDTLPAFLVVTVMYLVLFSIHVELSETVAIDVSDDLILTLPVSELPEIVIVMVFPTVTVLLVYDTFSDAAYTWLVTSTKLNIRTLKYL